MVESKKMSERDTILDRIRQALTAKAHASGVGLPSVVDQRRVLPKVGSTAEEQLALFQKNAAELRADCQLAGNFDDLKIKLRALGQAGGWRKVATHEGILARPAADSLGLPSLLVDRDFDKVQLETCCVGITECDALVAQTGSVLLTSRSAGGRALSCLPPHHVVIARRGQLVPDLPAAFALLAAKYGSDYPSMISFITGPSRTGDIERILVLGAHGPKKLTIFLLEDTAKPVG
jgi:L-lactate dehydrogenase complex protein LldG